MLSQCIFFLSIHTISRCYHIRQRDVTQIARIHDRHVREIDQSKNSLTLHREFARNRWIVKGRGITVFEFVHRGQLRNYETFHWISTRKSILFLGLRFWTRTSMTVIILLFLPVSMHTRDFFFSLVFTVNFPTLFRCSVFHVRHSIFVKISRNNSSITYNLKETDTNTYSSLNHATKK